MHSLIAQELIYPKAIRFYLQQKKKANMEVSVFDLSILILQGIRWCSWFRAIRSLSLCHYRKQNGMKDCLSLVIMRSAFCMMTIRMVFGTREISMKTSNLKLCDEFPVS